MEIDLNSHDDKLLAILGQLCAALMQRGLAHARQDDPHAYVAALRWFKEGAGRFQIRVDVDPAGGIVAAGLVNDASGEPVCAVFTLTGQKVGP